MLERLMISAVYVQAATVLHRLGNCQHPDPGRAPCMPSARGVYWHRITYGTVGRPKKRWREQLSLWRRNRSKGPIDDDDDDDDNVQ